jgi:hypothetical protein
MGVMGTILGFERVRARSEPACRAIQRVEGKVAKPWCNAYRWRYGRSTSTRRARCARS